MFSLAWDEQYRVAILVSGDADPVPWSGCGKTCTSGSVEAPGRRRPGATRPPPGSPGSRLQHRSITSNLLTSTWPCPGRESRHDDFGPSASARRRPSSWARGRSESPPSRVWRFRTTPSSTSRIHATKCGSRQTHCSPSRSRPRSWWTRRSASPGCFPSCGATSTPTRAGGSCCSAPLHPDWCDPSPSR